MCKNPKSNITSLHVKIRKKDNTAQPSLFIPGWVSTKKAISVINYIQRKKERNHMFILIEKVFDNICCCSVAKLCLTLCNPMKCSLPASLSFTISQSLLKLIQHPLTIKILSNLLVKKELRKTYCKHHTWW